MILKQGFWARHMHSGTSRTPWPKPMKTKPETAWRDWRQETAQERVAAKVVGGQPALSDLREHPQFPMRRTR